MRFSFSPKESSSQAPVCAAAGHQPAGCSAPSSLTQHHLSSARKAGWDRRRLRTTSLHTHVCTNACSQTQLHVLLGTLPICPVGSGGAEGGTSPWKPSCLGRGWESRFSTSNHCTPKALIMQTSVNLPCVQHQHSEQTESSLATQTTKQLPTREVDEERIKV